MEITNPYASKTILKDGAPELKEVCQPVTKDELDVSAIGHLCDKMFALMKENNGVGLAAPQVGVMYRVIVVSVDNFHGEVINPVITKRTGATNSIEGCLSFPGKTKKVKRAKTVVVEGEDRHGSPLKIKARGVLACCFQHEIDHLNGRTVF